MKKNSRLLIRLDYADGSQQGFGYDSWYHRHKKLSTLLESVKDDFSTIPEHVNIVLFYHTTDMVLGHISTWEELSAKITEIMGTA